MVRLQCKNCVIASEVSFSRWGIYKSMYTFYLTNRLLTFWRDGVMIKALDLRTGRGFDSRSFHFHVMTLCKLFIHMSPSSIIWYWPKVDDALLLGMSDVALAMRHSLSGIATIRAQWLGKRRRTLAYAPVEHGTFTLIVESLPQMKLKFKSVIYENGNKLP